MKIIDGFEYDGGALHAACLRRTCFDVDHFGASSP
jgi:hypothetical protein